MERIPVCHVKMVATSEYLLLYDSFLSLLPQHWHTWASSREGAVKKVENSAGKKGQIGCGSARHKAPTTRAFIE